MKKNEIFMIHGTDYKEMTKKLLEAGNLSEHIPDQNSRIGIKPNLVAPTPPSLGATTHPEIVAGIIEYLQERGYHKIVVMEGSWVGDSTEEALDICGYRQMLQEYGVDFIDTQKDTFHREDCRGMELHICDCVRKIDFLINVPVLKGHCQTRITCALKNLKGLLPNSEKRRFHSLGLHRPIAHLGAAVSQGFIVIDNICGDLDFEDGGNPVTMNRILAAADPVLADSYVCDFLHYKKEDVPYLEMAEKLGAGCGNLEKLSVSVCNDPAERMQVSPRCKVVEVQDKVEEVESCSACYGSLIPALDRLREEGLFWKLEDKICIGQGFRRKKGRLGVGNCTNEFQFCVRGCPPEEDQVYEFLKAYIRKEEKV